MTYGLRSPRILFLERFAKNRGKLPIIRARTRESRKRIVAFDAIDPDELAEFRIGWCGAALWR
jgi:hypothetical protein